MLCLLYLDMDALVLKSTGSSFTSFIRDEYTTLAEVDDRIFSTAVDLQYTFAPVNLPTPMDEKKLDFKLGESVKGYVWDATGVAQRARDITLKVFAEDDSASVQVKSPSLKLHSLSSSTV